MCPIYSSSWSKGLYLLLELPRELEPPLVFLVTIRKIHPPIPFPRVRSAEYRGTPSLMSTFGGSISNPGIATDEPSPLSTDVAPTPRRRSMDGTGEPRAIKEPVSALVAGVGMDDVASPKSKFISSKRTPRVSG
jgi:hypothetical protein